MYTNRELGCRSDILYRSVYSFLSLNKMSIDKAGNDIVRANLQALLMQFNRSMRLYARKLGYSLNQRGLSTGIIRGKDGLKQTEG